jgi:hypothetical protein
MEESSRFNEAIRQFDLINAADPNLDTVDGIAYPRELLYATRLTNALLQLQPQATEPLRLAARCQHLARWTIPRNSYPMTRPGYLQWRNDLKSFHANKAASVLREIGYPDDVIARVHLLVTKQEFPRDPDAQTLEDALCLVFLQFQLDDLARKTPEPKILNALRKSWQKMSPAARNLALQLNLSPTSQSLLHRALSLPS